MALQLHTHSQYLCAVIGMGRAGRSRVQALEGRVDISGVVRSSRRDSITQSLTAVLANPNIDAVIVSRETQAHAQTVREALNVGKHVLVEYPLALSAAETEGLIALAAERKRYLHVGLVGLMTIFHQEVTQRLIDIRACKATFDFSGGYGRAIREEASRGYWGELATSRLHSLWAWFGPLSFQNARIETRSDGYRLTVNLVSETGAKVDLLETRISGSTRHKTITIKNKDGRVDRLEHTKGSKGAFARDLDCFIRRLRGEDLDGISKHHDAIIAVAHLAEKISRHGSIHSEEQRS